MVAKINRWLPHYTRKNYNEIYLRLKIVYRNRSFSIIVVALEKTVESSEKVGNLIVLTIHTITKSVGNDHGKSYFPEYFLHCINMWKIVKNSDEKCPKMFELAVWIKNILNFLKRVITCLCFLLKFAQMGESKRWWFLFNMHGLMHVSWTRVKIS